MNGPLQNVLGRVKGATPLRATANGQTCAARCPAHDDRTASLSITAKSDGTLLLYCHAGCETEAVVHALGLAMRDLRPVETRAPSPPASGRVVTRYDYTNDCGRLLFQAERTEPKGFRQRRPLEGGGWAYNLDGVEPVLYRLPETLAAVAAGQLIFVTEGEKDADALRALGFAATCNPMGAGKWRVSYTGSLAGARVVVLPDNDGPGRSHARDVASSLLGVGADVRIVELPDLPPKGDVSDWLAAGHTADDLRGEVDRATSVTEASLGLDGSCRPRTDSAQDPGGKGQHDPAASYGSGVQGFDQILARFRSGAELAAEPAPETSWVVSRLLPRGALVQLTGATKGAGKTTLLCHALAAVRRGEDFLGEPTETCPVVYLTEQARSTFEPEYLAPSGLLGDHALFVLYGYEAKGHTFEAIVAAAVEKCRLEAAGVLALDTFGYWAKVEDENDAAQMQRQLRPLQDAAASGLCVVVVHHDRKGGGETWDAGRGSSAFAGAVDVIVNVRRPQGGQHPTIRELRCEGRYGDLYDSLIVELTPEGYVAQGTARAVAQAATEAALTQAAPTNEGDALSLPDLLDTVRELQPSASRTSLQRAVKVAEEAGRLRRIGRGRKGDPHRFYRPSGGSPLLVARHEEGLGQKESRLGDGLPEGPRSVTLSPGRAPWDDEDPL